MPDGESGEVADPSPDTSTPAAPVRGGRWLRRTTACLVVLVLVAAGASYRFDLGDRLGIAAPSPVDEPAEVAPPPGLTLPEVPTAEPVAEPVPPLTADPAAVRRALRPELADRRLGPQVAAGVTQVADGRTVLRQGPRRVIPASTLKLLTSGAALSQLGGDHRFSTKVVAGSGRREVVLVGGGDPFLARRPATDETLYPARADLVTLARSTARALRATGREKVSLRYDASLFTGPAVSPRWEPSYLPDNVVSPISALWVDEGRLDGSYLRSSDPALDAALAFEKALRGRNIRVVGEPRPGSAATGSEELAVVQSAPLAQVVERVLDVSDNEGAEVLLRQVAIAAGEPASFAGGSRAVLATLRELGVAARGDRIYDGSGLSRDDLVAPETLLTLLDTASAPDHPELRPLLTGLPVAGFTGSLAVRFDTGSPLGLGLVRAKTGTLVEAGVHGLAGTVTTRDGVVLSFVLVADKVRVSNTLAARAILDRAAAALAACRCAG